MVSNTTSAPRSPPGSYPTDERENTSIHKLVEDMERLNLTASQKKNRRRRHAKKKAKAKANEDAEVLEEVRNGQENENCFSTYALPRFDFEKPWSANDDSRDALSHDSLANEKAAAKEQTTAKEMSRNMVTVQKNAIVDGNRIRKSDYKGPKVTANELDQTVDSPTSADEPSFEIIDNIAILEVQQLADDDAGDDFEIIEKSEAS